MCMNLQVTDGTCSRMAHYKRVKETEAPDVSAKWQKKIMYWQSPSNPWIYRYYNLDICIANLEDGSIKQATDR